MNKMDKILVRLEAELEREATDLSLDRNDTSTPFPQRLTRTLAGKVGEVLWPEGIEDIVEPIEFPDGPDGSAE